MFGATTLVVHAHPDDEMFATGAAITAAVAAGSTVRLRIFTGGELRGRGVDAAGLVAARHRREEMLTRSAKLLGVDDWAYLSEPGRWLDTPDMLAPTIGAAPLEELAEVVVAAIDELRPEVVLTAAAVSSPDHMACHRAVALAVTRSMHRPDLVLAAYDFDRGSIERARQRAFEMFGREPDSSSTPSTPSTGSVEEDPAIVVVTGPADAERRRREAMDVYHPGLGTLPIDELETAGFDTPEKVMARLQYDEAGWGTDRFMPIPTR
jgi:LmbE family N-acetylglucosaminyl deacetylase